MRSAIYNGTVVNGYGEMEQIKGAAHHSEMNEGERWFVKAVMDRVKVALASCVPVLWLMASGQDLADPCGRLPYGQRV